MGIIYVPAEGQSIGQALVSSRVLYVPNIARCIYKGEPVYVDATTGDDDNDGRSPATAWKTIAKVNASTFNPGEQILFKRGETWREQLTVPGSGEEGNPIVFGAYGSGEKPIISGTTPVTGWANQSYLGSSVDRLGADFESNFFYGWSSKGSGVIAQDKRAKFTANETTPLPLKTYDLSYGGTLACHEMWYSCTLSFESFQAIGENPVFQMIGTRGTVATSKRKSTLAVRAVNETLYLSFVISMDSGQTYYDLVPLETDTEYRVACYWKAATAAGANNGICKVWLNEVIKVNLSNLDTDVTGERVEFNLGVYYRSNLNAVFYVDDVRAGTNGADPTVAPVSVGWLWKADVLQEPSSVWLGDTRLAKIETKYLPDAWQWYWNDNVLYLNAPIEPEGLYLSDSQQSVLIDGVSYVEFSGLRATQSAVGIKLDTASNITLSDCIANDNKTGIELGAVTDTVVARNSLNGNMLYGIASVADENSSTGIVVGYNEIRQNGASGVYISANQSGVIANNNIDSNQQNGVHFVGVSDISLVNNQLCRNGVWQLLAESCGSFEHSHNNVWDVQLDVASINGTTYNKSTVISGYEPTAVSASPELDERMAFPVLSAWQRDDLVLAAKYPNEIHLSTNGGTSFTLVKTIADATSIKMTFIAADGSFYYSAEGASLGNDDKGVFRSTDNGANWSRVLDLSAQENPCSIWGVAELSDGTLVMGNYGKAADDYTAYLYRSIDGGDTFSVAHTESAARHFHHIHATADDVLYACYGDNISPWFTYGTVKSIDGGVTWVDLDIGIQLTDISSSPTCRVFGSDSGRHGIILRSTDDVVFEPVFTLPGSYAVVWVRYDATNARFFASVVPNGADGLMAAIYASDDDGMSWYVYRAISAPTDGKGSWSASNAAAGRLYAQAYSDRFDAGLVLLTAPNDMSLQAGSPCIGAGTDVGLTTDFAGNPVADPPSIGAYEYIDTLPLLALVTADGEPLVTADGEYLITGAV